MPTAGVLSSLLSSIIPGTESHVFPLWSLTCHHFIPFFQFLRFPSSQAFVVAHLEMHSQHRCVARDLKLEMWTQGELVVWNGYLTLKKVPLGTGIWSSDRALVEQVQGPGPHF